MIEVTANSNVYISVQVYAGPPCRFLDAARARLFRLSVSAPLPDGICRVLRDKFLWSQERLDELPVRLKKFTELVHSTTKLDVVKDDPDDNRVRDAGSQFIVTGGHHLLELGRFGAIQIVKVADFLKLLPSQ